MPMNSRLLVPRAFSPANIPGLAAWLDAADEGTQVVDVGVTSWRSKTPGGLLFTQATGSAQPGIGAAPNGRRALTFNGTTQAISAGITSLFAAVPGVTTFVAFLPDNAAISPGYAALVDVNAGGSFFDRASVYARQSTVEAGGRRLDADSYEFVQRGTTSNGVFYIGSGAFNYESATLTAGLNLSSTDRAGGFQTTGVSSNTSGQFTIGANTSGGPFNNFFDGTIGEVVVYNRPLNTAERQRIIRWLASRWGVVL